VEFTTIPLAAKPNCSKPAELATKSNLFSLRWAYLPKILALVGRESKRFDH
jgi:hypothetical protein